MSLDSKLTGARAILEAHNSQSTKPVDIDEFLKNLTDMGGSSEEALEEATWEDLENCGAPRILARKIATLFRGGDQPSARLAQKVIIEETDPDKLAKAMTLAQLVDVYDPKQPKSAVAERLAFFSEGKKFIVFNDDGTVNREITLKLLEELDDHGEMPTYVAPDGSVKPTYTVGEKPSQAAHEHPLYPDTPLRGGASSAGCEWGTIDLQIQQTLYLAVTETNEIDMRGVSEWDIFDIAVGGVAKVNRRFIQAAKLYNERKALGNLPSLRVKLGKSKTENKGNNPFNLGQNRST
jgi:hypothetical protein